MKVLALALVVVLAALPRMTAHHDPRPTYDDTVTRTIQGSVISLTLRNPHSFMQVAVKAPGRAEVRYDLEWNGADDLRRAGVMATTFHSGDRIVVTGQPGRGTSDRRLRVTMLRRPSDGFVWAQPMSH
jgi:hypothetical protein